MKRRHFVTGLLSAGGLTALEPARTIGLTDLTGKSDPAKVLRVLVMFKCHLDVGFDNTQAAIMRLYFDQYFPKAMEIGQKMSEPGGHPYMWTTGSWMLYEYLDQANAEQRKRVENAVAAGHLAWHALPFTWQTEMLDRTMITGSLGFSKSLDRRFGRTTTGAKMTDVPGHTRGIIGPLAENGVKFLHIGVNSASTPPEVPPLFLWKDTDGKELIVMYHPDYGGTFQLTGSDLAVSIEVKDDNLGPHNSEEISTIYQRLQTTYPNAKIKAASLTDIAEAIAPFNSQLPVVTQEIGDTWIHGVPSDPIKISRYREMARLRREWLSQGKLHSGDAVDLALLRRLTLAAEHGTGTDTKLYLDYDHYKPADLAQVLNLPGYKSMTTSWAEKRQDIEESIASLPTPLKAQAVERMLNLSAKEPTPGALKPHNASSELETEHFNVEIDPQTGALCSLREKAGGRSWASPKNLLGLFTYQTLSKEDFDRFIASYIHSTEDWAFKDFGKPGIERFGARNRDWAASLVHLWAGVEGNTVRVIAELRVNDPETEKLGIVAWPQKMFTEFIFPNDEPIVKMNFCWFGKAANRLPEAAWFSFLPDISGEAKCSLDKSDRPVLPLDIVPGGNRHMHAVTRDIRIRHADRNFAMETLDAPVVALGEKTPLYFSREQPDLRKGIHFCLHNNVWGTNYPQWFGEDMRFRFVLRLKPL